jgi:TldD protein
LVGEQRRAPGSESLEHKLGTRLLPGSFQVWDDPTTGALGGQTLLGHYRFDDEAVPAGRVDLVKDGRLNTLCLSRAPTRKLSGSNGHGRASSGAGPRASVANLFVQDEKGLTGAELKQELLNAARDEGLDYAVRVESVQLPGALSSRADLLSYWNRSGRTAGKLGDPVVAWKVSVKDGSETPIRGVEFAPLEVRALRRILAAGTQPAVFNHLGLEWSGAGVPVTVVAPSVLLEEMELSKIQEEFERQPILKAPAHR